MTLTAWIWFTGIYSALETYLICHWIHGRAENKLRIDHTRRNASRRKRNIAKSARPLLNGFDPFIPKRHSSSRRAELRRVVNKLESVTHELRLHNSVDDRLTRIEPVLDDKRQGAA